MRLGNNTDNVPARPVPCPRGVVNDNGPLSCKQLDDREAVLGLKDTIEPRPRSLPLRKYRLII